MKDHEHGVTSILTLIPIGAAGESGNPDAELGLQVSGHEARGLVDERLHRFTRHGPGVVQHCVVRQRLDRGHAYKRRELQVIDIEFALTSSLPFLAFGSRVFGKTNPHQKAVLP